MNFFFWLFCLNFQATENINKSTTEIINIDDEDNPISKNNKINKKNHDWQFFKEIILTVLIFLVSCMFGYYFGRKFLKVI